RKDAGTAYRADTLDLEGFPEKNERPDKKQGLEDQLTLLNGGEFVHRVNSIWQWGLLAPLLVSDDYGRGIPSSSGETFASPVSSSTQLVTDCQRVMKSSASWPLIYMGTMPETSMNSCTAAS